MAGFKSRIGPSENGNEGTAIAIRGVDDGIIKVDKEREGINAISGHFGSFGK